MRWKTIRLRLHATNEAGSALVELALTMPLLLCITTGTCAFGFAINTYMQLTNATNVGGLVLADARGATSDPCTTAIDAVLNASPLLNNNASKVNFALVFTSSDGTAIGTYTGTGTSTTGESGSGSSQVSCATMVSSGDFAQGISAQLQVQYQGYSLPFQPAFLKGGVFGPYNLTAQITEIIQ
jgi:Flp pilus assembly protein TadG